jgi:adenylylsulfate kinase
MRQITPRKILIYGLNGSGKTHLAERLSKHLECAWYNADVVRGQANDWDFSPEGRLRQATRMRTFADFEKGVGRTVICDFIAPTIHSRNMFDADIEIWMNTVQEGRFEDTNKIFEKPKDERCTDLQFIITKFLSDEEIKEMGELIGG